MIIRLQYLSGRGELNDRWVSGEVNRYSISRAVDLPWGLRGNTARLNTRNLVSITVSERLKQNSGRWEGWPFISKTIDLLWCWVRILDSRSCSGTRCDAGLLWRSSGILSRWRAVVLGRVVICDCLDGALGNSRHRIAWT